MIFRLTVSIALSLLAIADAGKITFSKAGKNIFVETDPSHFVLYGPVSDRFGPRSVAVNRDDLYYQTSTCSVDKRSLSSIDSELQDKYAKLREKFLGVRVECPATSGRATNSYIWS